MSDLKSAESVLKRISSARLHQLEKSWNLAEKSDALAVLLSQDQKTLMKLLFAASQAILEAGEIASGQEGRLTDLKQVADLHRKLLYDEASQATLLANFQYFLIDPAEAEKFVDLLLPEAKESLARALEDD